MHVPLYVLLLQIRDIPRRPINRFKVAIETERKYHRLYDQRWRAGLRRSPE